MAGFTRSKWRPKPGQPGPYEAIVVSHLDPKYMGTLQVEILRKSDSGNDPERTGQMVEAKYLSPFYGSTPLGATTGNPGYQHTQKSYGFWAIPPDVGTRVLVIFSEGNFANAYWIGCVQDEYMNFMTPGYAATKNLEDFGKKAPAGEYNKRRETGDARQPNHFQKAVHVDLTKVLVRQGLIDDDIRGTTTSSARREIPSAVFGISTPGPVDKRTDSLKFERGTYGNKANSFVSRLGGSSIVMDDGDDKLLRKGSPKNSGPEYENLEALADGEIPTGDVTLPANELLRLKTRTGHQILLHNTEDLIYIGNARGTSWIEMTSNGKIDIFAQDSVSVHSTNDINYTADRDINFTAGENVNFMVGKDFRITAGDSFHNTTGNDINNTAGQSISEIAGTYISNYAGLDASYQSFRDTSFQTGKNLEIGAGSNINLESTGHLYLTSQNDARIKVNQGGLALSIDGDIDLQNKNINVKSETVSLDTDKFILHSDSVVNIHADRFAVNTDTTTEIHSDGSIYSLANGSTQIQANQGMKLAAIGSAIQMRGDSGVATWARDGDFLVFAGKDVRLDANEYMAHTAKGLVSIKSVNDNDPNTQGTLSAEVRGGVAIQSGAGIDLLALGTLSDSAGTGVNESGQIRIETKGSYQLKVEQNHTADVREAFDFKGAKNIAFQAGEQFLIKATDEIQMKGSKTELQPTTDPAVDIQDIDAAEEPVAASAGLNNYKPFNALEVGPTGSNYDAAYQGVEAAKYYLPFVGRVQWNKYDSARLSVKPVYADKTDLPPVFAIDPTPAVYADRVARIPMHEPWYQHENLDPLAFTPDKTRAGAELPDIYVPQLPDTFATTPEKQSDIGEVTQSVTFDPETLILGTGSEYSFNEGLLGPWRTIAAEFGLLSELSNAVFTVIVSQYGSWNYGQTETVPVTDKQDPVQVAQLIRKRYPSLAERRDSHLLELAQAGAQDFFATAYGYNTEYGRALGNTVKTDCLDFRGRGPYLGIIGKGMFRKLQRFIQAQNGILIEQVQNPFQLSPLGHRLMLAAFVHAHYKDHGRGTLGNVRIMLFGTEDYELMHPRDVEIYKRHISPAGTRTRENDL